MGKSRRVLTALAVAASGLGAVTLLVRSMPAKSLAGLSVSVVSPYVAALTVGGVAAAGYCRSRALWAVSVVVAALGVGTQVLWYYVASPGDVANPGDPGDHAAVRVLSSNIRNGEADAASFVGLAERSADVIVVVELTPEAVQRFSSAGLDRTFPYSHLIPAPLAGGIGMWSRFPLVPLPVPQHPYATAPAVLLDVPGVPGDAVLVGVHVKSPLSEGRDTVGDWNGGIEHLRSQLTRFAHTAGAEAVLVAGDFNATPDVRQFRDLLDDGYRDAVEQLGAGFSPTFPADRWYPPLYTIDHVLTRNSAVTSVRTVDITGSDHRALLAVVAIPRQSGAGR